MKKTLILTLVALMLAGLASVAFASVVGSKHDLGTGGATANAGGTDSGQVCAFCHHPHRGVSPGGVQPFLLWNNDDWDAAWDLTTYNSNTINSGNTPLNATTDYQSYLCLGCHDGSLSANSLINVPSDSQKNNTVMNLTSVTLGTVLTDDHPINFDYDAARADGSNKDSLGSMEYPQAINQIISAASLNEYKLFANKMQCATCHDVHAGNNTKDSNTTKIQFMRGDTNGSEICIDCHTWK